ncbi:A-kinase anchor protein 13-like, partial [Haliotis rufescens]|uniref:A-kinase anchor protein 13-like n=1 Tax=Haliotis rufescens TaxID=6454 RepID=UPI00201EAC2F
MSNSTITVLSLHHVRSSSLVIPPHGDLGEGLLKEVTEWIRSLVHGVSEDVRLSVYQVHDGKTCVVCLDTFHFHYDSAYHMAVFLIDSVYNIHALDDLELIKSEQFDLANEIVSTLDERLVSALKSIYLPIGWNILGDDTDDLCQDRETLLHFAARLGLREVSLFLLEQPGGETATQIKNRHGETPAEIATEHGYQEVAELISG